jgi:hypothetical protein
VLWKGAVLLIWLLRVRGWWSRLWWDLQCWFLRLNRSSPPVLCLYLLHVSRFPTMPTTRSHEIPVSFLKENFATYDTQKKKEISM